MNIKGTVVYKVTNNYKVLPKGSIQSLQSVFNNNDEAT